MEGFGGGGSRYGGGRDAGDLDCDGGGGGGVRFCAASLWLRICNAAARLIDILSCCSGVRRWLVEVLGGGGVLVRLGGGVAYEESSALDMMCASRLARRSANEFRSFSICVER